MARANHGGAAGEQRRHPPREVTAALVGLTALGVLVVYFGREWARAHARALGLHENVLGLSAADQLARGVAALAPLALLVGGAGLGWAWLDRRLRPWWRRTGHSPVLSQVTSVLAGSWLLLPMLVWVVGRAAPGPARVLLPLSFGAGLLVSLYVLHLEHVVRRGRAEPRWRHTLVTALTVVVVSLSLLWGAKNYADLLGRRWADEFPARLADHAQVVVYSAERLHLTAPRVDEERLDAEESRYRYRYSGLRFLDYAAGRYLLVSDGWMPQFGVVLVLPANDPSVRLEFVRDSRVP
ncbi:hypothetical protein LX15_002683 [Streptoalloteichus tenebrarius]|uniref:DUF3592 domain-containing protein n=1 Tax=Streptoalloteichus tenebrarius (strain ATCC 17920 / DSM 40477 / JCM 4838 / CBS 697.72 / NBRC 16177 / NCIMB 11028 / NRRL B-12390 / A12253. 1 / ISP 5477) TaxID=1933 RepID=A0ABT1HTZ1_STRSD|nr:hypothetical protein [Streptoalloteichus tenebrarius]MCP2258984.1 hypothetical protein [Streptoalloteichus tenebrarius]BFF01193.1 hypothetical protein GCM10020241_28680 [Streptoalloteichus tenebrarius]